MSQAALGTGQCLPPACRIPQRARVIGLRTFKRPRGADFRENQPKSLCCTHRATAMETITNPGYAGGPSPLGEASLPTEEAGEGSRGHVHVGTGPGSLLLPVLGDAQPSGSRIREQRAPPVPAARETSAGLCAWRRPGQRLHRALSGPQARESHTWPVNISGVGMAIFGVQLKRIPEPQG